MNKKNRMINLGLTAVLLAPAIASINFGEAKAARDVSGCLVEATTPIGRTFDGKIPVLEYGKGYGVTELATMFKYRLAGSNDTKTNLTNPDGCGPGMPNDLVFPGMYQDQNGDYRLTQDGIPIVK